VRDVQSHGVALTGQRALVLGAGGSARAIVYGLAEAGCAEIAILNRTESKAQELADTMGSFFPDCAISAHPMPGAIATVAARADLVVNCTSLGMTPHVEGLPWDADIPFHSGQAVYDLVYNPPQTRLLQKAAADGAQAINGLGMLIWQGAIAFELWTGVDAPVPVMRRAVEAIFAARS
jgi:shikimate dehydrogenase